MAKEATVNKETEQKLGWKPFIKFYTRFRIPWFYLIAATLVSMGAQELAVMVVPYTSKIMTGAITEGGFLVGFLILSLAVAFAEAFHETMLDMMRIKSHRNVTRSVWRRLVHLPMSYFSKNEPQELVSRVTKDTEGALGAVSVLVLSVSTLFGVVETFRRMYATYKSLALIMLCGIPVLLITSIIVGKLQYRIIYIQNKAMSRMTNFFAERLPGIIHIKTSNMETEEMRRGHEENDRRYRAEMKAEKLFIISTPISSLSNYIFELVLLILASALVRAGVMKMFQMVNLYNYFMLFMTNSFMLLAVWQGIKQSQGASVVTATIMNTPMEEVDQGTELSPMNEPISFEHVSFSYDGKTPILKDVSFVIPKGKKTVIVGENGSGKSTIIKLLERFEEPTGGTIRIGGKALNEVKLSDLREKMGYLFQGNQIVAGTIRENITYGIDRNCTEEEIRAAAEKASALGFIQEKEAGFDTEISRFENKVSGGEMQRIAVARMLLKQPLYLIMDEATSGIDAVSQQAVMDSVDAMMEDKTVIMVSHNMDEIRQADHIIVLNEGLVEASGTYEDVIEESPLMRRFEAISGEIGN